MKSHLMHDCIAHIKSQPSADQVPLKVFEILQGFEESGLDPLLGTFSRVLQADKIPHVLTFLRTFKILDVSDYEEITNKYVHKTTEEEIMALVDRMNTKGPHAYWYFVHAMELVNQEFFDQMHGKLACCVCEEVTQNFDLLSRKESEKECTLMNPEASSQMSKQKEVMSDLMARVEQLSANFSYLESSITDIMEKLKPFPHMVGNLSQRVRDEIQDVMHHPSAGEEVGGHTNVTFIKCLKEKCSQFRRQIEGRLQSTSRQVEVDIEDTKSAVLQEIVFKEPKAIDDHRIEVKETHPCRTYEDIWIEFEDRCFERLSQYNPFIAIQHSISNILVSGQKHRGKVFCAIGIAICLKIAVSYLQEYSEWTDGPRPMLT